MFFRGNTIDNLLYTSVDKVHEIVQRGTFCAFPAQRYELSCSMIAADPVSSSGPSGPPFFGTRLALSVNSVSSERFPPNLDVFEGTMPVLSPFRQPANFAGIVEGSTSWV